VETGRLVPGHLVSGIMMIKIQGRAVDNKRLMGMLGNALQKEATLWKPLAYKATTSLAQEIGPEHRNNAVRWLVQLTAKFHFMPETLALSVTILDRFLQSVKARPRHLNCIGVASFYLAAKTVEEDQVIPGTLELVQESHCGCSVAEVLRMERCILDKLGWDLRAATPLEFLQIFHALLMSNYPHLLDSFVHMTPSRQMAVMISKLQVIAMDQRCLLYSPSSVALALLSLELEQFWPEWFAATITLQKLVQVEVSEVICCRELLSSILMSGRLPSTLHLYAPSKTAVVSTISKAGAKRKVEQMEEEDDIYDGIKRLYNEDDGGGGALTVQCTGCTDHVDTTAPHVPMAVAN